MNQATRVVDQLTDQDKTYRFTVQFGVETDTLDRTGQVIHTREAPACSEDELESALERFRCSYLQEVPRYSAVKVQGRRLYSLTRSGIDVEELPSREVHIRSLELLDVNWPRASFEACCSKGTYIRQLAADIGRYLGCGGHVSELRRLASGHFRIDQAVSIDELDEAVSRGIWREKLIPVSDALAHLPAAVLEDAFAVQRLVEGQMDPVWEAENRTRFPVGDEPVRILTPSNHLIALWWPHPGPEQKRRLRVFGPVPET
jgi:tRNA pseudouridine55 synthase